jgi:exodeoxyribonuclease VII small subunit
MATRKKTAARKTGKPNETSINFEKAMAELETLVANMEQGEQSLEASLKDFERGVELTRICQTALKEAEQKVQILSKKMGGEELVPFDEEDLDA